MYDSMSPAQKRLVCRKAREVVATMRRYQTRKLPGSADRCLAGVVARKCGELSVQAAAVVEALAGDVLAGTLAESELNNP